MTRHLLVLALVALVSLPRYGGWTADDTRQAMEHHSALANCIVTLETGHTLDPYSVGKQGELGVAQLHPQGLLDSYLIWSGGASPYDPYTSMNYLEWALGQGLGSHWSTYWYCR